MERRWTTSCGLWHDLSRTAKLSNRVFESRSHSYENYEKAFSRKALVFLGALFTPKRVAIYNTTPERRFQSSGVAEPPESLTGTPDLTVEYPLVLSDYHTSNNYSASWARNVPWLRELQPEPVLHIHPDAAAEREIKDGDPVIVESPHGWLKVKAELCPGIRPDTVMILHGWWQGCRELGFKDYPLLDGGANVNNMYSVDMGKVFDPLITAMSSQTLCRSESLKLNTE